MLSLFNYFRFYRKPPPMTLQDAYEKIRAHFLTQKVRAVNDGGSSCRYRTYEGLMCAVGCLITDDNYSPDLEGKSISSPPVQRAVQASTGLPIEGNNAWDGSPVTNEYQFLHRAQSIHDLGGDNLDTNGVERLDALAKEFNLNVKA